MKTIKPLTEAELNELPKLPDSWVWTKLGEIAYINSGNTPKFLIKAENKGQFPFYKVSDMNSEGNEIWIKTSNLYLTNEEKALFKVKEEKKGTIIFPKRGGAILTNKKRRFSCNASFDLNIMGVKEASNHILNDFLWYWFSKLDLRKLYDGSNVPQINNKDIEPLLFPLPPLPEQRAIVSKIELLFSELDNGIANLKLAQEQLKVYRQAVLKKAFEGELTRKWREQQTNLPDARDLLEHIRKEREEAAKTSGKKTKIVKSLTENDLSELPRLPEKWLWVKFGEACDKIFDGTHFSPKNNPQGDYKYITAKNIKGGYLDLSDLSYVTKKDHCEIFSRCDVKKGDILYIKDGATTGKACMNPLNEEFSLLSSVGVFRVNEKFISPKYIEHYLNAEVTRHQVLKNVAGVAITRLTLVKLNNSTLILPPNEEQQTIVLEIETRLSICDKVEQDIEDNLVIAEALRQSILKKAFEGKLLNERELEEVCNADDWEPAEVLVERIKAEKVRDGKKIH